MINDYCGVRQEALRLKRLEMPCYANELRTRLQSQERHQCHEVMIARPSLPLCYLI